MDYYEWMNKESLKASLRKALASPARRQQQAAHNLVYCEDQRMEKVVDDYLDLAEELLARRGATAVTGF
jgi:hypothetical protein